VTERHHGLPRRRHHQKPGNAGSAALGQGGPGKIADRRAVPLSGGPARCSGLYRRVAAAVVAVAALVTGMLAAGGPAARAAAPQVISVNGASPGRVFDGVGAISASSSRLLYDYPAPERNQILNYLFSPDYGASLQILKVEIGSDANSTVITEPSIERTRGQVDCGRGYEWWLMEQAKARNPRIRFYGLAWGAPGWFHSDPGKPDTTFNRFFSRDNIRYLMNWMGCARQHGLQVSYLGGWNEVGFTTSQEPWFEALHKALVAHHLSTQIVAADMWGSTQWNVAAAMKRNPAFDAAIGVVGVHDPCVGAKGDYESCPSPADAKGLGKPLWDSETSSLTTGVGAPAIARSLNRDYIDGRMTANIYWSLVASWYADLPIPGTGLMTAETPWSGYYDLGKTIWTVAQTTQFAQPGWRYLNGASGHLAGGSYVTLRSPRGGDYSMILETTEATAPQTIHVSVAGGLSTGTVHEWSTNLASSDPNDYFVHTGDIRPTDGGYTVTLAPDHVYTLSTTTGQHKGPRSAVRPAGGAGQASARQPGAASGPAAQMPLPYRQTFNGYRPGQLAPYFLDVSGGFQAEPCADGRRGMCYQQSVPQKPIPWAPPSTSPAQPPPATLVGDSRWWGNYQVSADVLLPRPGEYAELFGRVDGEHGPVSGYHLRLASSGRWKLYSEDIVTPDVTLASGSIPMKAGSWHQLALRFTNNRIRVLIDHHQVAAVTDDHHTTGQVGLGSGGWYPVQFDNLTVTPTTAAPRFVPHAGMTAAATSTEASDGRYTYVAANAIDDNPGTRWNARTSPPATLPQSITLDLGRQYPVRALTYQPQLDTNAVGMITKYAILLSENGKTFTQVASGSWPASTATKIAAWGGGHRARYVRLEAITADGQGEPNAAEINVATTPVRMSTLRTTACRTSAACCSNRPASSRHAPEPPATTATSRRMSVLSPNVRDVHRCRGS